MGTIKRTIKVIWLCLSGLALVVGLWMFQLFYERHLLIDFDDNGRGVDTQGFPVHDTTFVYAIVSVVLVLPAVGTALVALGRKLKGTR